MGDCTAITLRRNKYVGREPKALSTDNLYPANLLGRGYVMCRLILGLVLAMLLLLTVSTSAQENTNVSDSSAQASMDGGVIVPTETAGGQEAAYGAEEMNQMIQTIEGGSSGTEEAALGSGIADGSADTTKTSQVAESTGVDSGTTAGADQTLDTIKEAKEMDHMIQTIEANGSTNTEADQNARAAGAGSEGAADQSKSTGPSSGEYGGSVQAGAGQDSGNLNQTKSMDKMIQTLVENDENGTSETAHDNASFNEPEPAEQSIQMPANTESIGLLIQALADNENSTSMAAVSTSMAAVSTSMAAAKSTETIEKTKSIDRVIQTLEDYGYETAGSNDAASGQDIEIVDEVDSMDKMIQALEGSDIQQE